MAVANKDSRFPQLYVDPYEEPPVSVASTPSTDLPTREEVNPAVSASQNPPLSLSGVNGTVDMTDSRPPGDGASARRDMPPLSVVPASNEEDDADTFHSPCAEDRSTDSPPPPIIPRAAAAVPENPSAGNYDEPWDLTSKFRQLEEKFRAVPARPGQAAASQATPVNRPRSQVSEDTRVLADGYDWPWDLQPHRRDLRDDVGYDKPWDLKPHEKDVRASVAAAGDYDAPWDIKPRSVVEREVIAAKSAKEAAVAAAARPVPGPRASTSSTSSASEPTADSSSESGRKPLPQYDEPWDQIQKQLVGKVAAGNNAVFSGGFKAESLLGHITRKASSPLPFRPSHPLPSSLSSLLPSLPSQPLPFPSPPLPQK